MRIRLKYVVEDTDRHGNVRLYFRRKGRPKVRLPAPLGSPEFLGAYRAAKDGTAQRPAKTAKPAAGTLRALCQGYYTSAAFKQLDARTQRVRRGILDRFCDNRHKGESDGERPYSLVQSRHIRERRDAISSTPEAANSLVKALRQLFAYGVTYDLMERNPAKDVEYLRSGSDGFHSWDVDEIRQVEAKHPVGSKARLAMALALHTGQRRSDIVKLGRQHIKDGRFVLTQHKNRNSAPVRLEIPIIPELRRIIDASSTGDLTFLTTAFGRPFTFNGFGNRFRKWCDEPIYRTAAAMD